MTTSSYSYIPGIRRQSQITSDLNKSFNPFIKISIIFIILLGLILFNIIKNESPLLDEKLRLFSNLRKGKENGRGGTNYKKGSLPPIKGCQNLLSTSLEPREKAAIILLLRESDLDSLIPTLINFEQRFNKIFRYPYIFISSPDNPPFSSSFKSTIISLLPSSASIKWSTVPHSEWSIPPWMNEIEVREGFKKQEDMGVQYAGREGYHHMCRFYSGYWARLEVLSEFDWFWRLEPGVEFYSTITYDPFRFLSQNSKIYGFVITIIEDLETIPNLFKTFLNYTDRKGLSWDEGMWEFFTRPAAGKKEEGEEGEGGREFTACHLWTNFEIGDLRFFRSPEYQDLFNSLDSTGGFYTERWGDAPIRSLALGLLAGIDKIHFFEDFAYKHDKFIHSPSHSSGLGCHLDLPSFDEGNLDIDNNYWYSCLPRWKEVCDKFGRYLEG